MARIARIVVPDGNEKDSRKSIKFKGLLTILIMVNILFGAVYAFDNRGINSDSLSGWRYTDHAQIEQSVPDYNQNWNNQKTIYEIEQMTRESAAGYRPDMGYNPGNVPVYYGRANSYTSWDEYLSYINTSPQNISGVPGCFSPYSQRADLYPVRKYPVACRGVIPNFTHTGFNTPCEFSNGIYFKLERDKRSAADYSQAIQSITTDEDFFKTPGGKLFHKRSVAYGAVGQWDKPLSDFGTVIIPDFAVGFEENGLTSCQDKSPDFGELDEACEQKNHSRIQCNTARTLLLAQRSHGKKLETFYQNPIANSGIMSYPHSAQAWNDYCLPQQGRQLTVASLGRLEDSRIDNLLEPALSVSSPFIQQSAAANPDLREHNNPQLVCSFVPPLSSGTDSGITSLKTSNSGIGSNTNSGVITVGYLRVAPPSAIKQTPTVIVKQTARETDDWWIASGNIRERNYAVGITRNETVSKISDIAHTYLPQVYIRIPRLDTMLTERPIVTWKYLPHHGRWPERYDFTSTAPDNYFYLKNIYVFGIGIEFPNKKG